MPRHEDIALRAYLIWEKAGRPNGCDWEHWITAEQELAGEAGGMPASAMGGRSVASTAASQTPMSAKPPAKPAAKPVAKPAAKPRSARGPARPNEPGKQS
jgi:hypothetical protein